MRGQRWVWATVVVVLAGALSGAAGASTRTGGSAAAAKATKITLQLKWVTQAQFAGYYVAKAKGYYSAQGLDVSIKVGGPNIVPEQVVAGGQAQFGIDWLSSLMSSRDKGIDLVNIGQVCPRAGRPPPRRPPRHSESG